jgi:hypothetical protein
VRSRAGYRLLLVRPGSTDAAELTQQALNLFPLLKHQGRQNKKAPLCGAFSLYPNGYSDPGGFGTLAFQRPSMSSLLDCAGYRYRHSILK